MLNCDLCNSFEIESNHNGKKLNMLSGATVSINRTYQKYVFTLDYPQKTDVQTANILSTIDEDDTLSIELPTIYNQTIPISVSTNASQGDAAVSLKTTTGLTAGKYIKFDNHNKLYKIKTIAGNDITIYPDLISDITTSHRVISTNIQLGCDILSSVKFSVDTSKLSTIVSLRVSESL